MANTKTASFKTIGSLLQRSLSISAMAAGLALICAPPTSAQEGAAAPHNGVIGYAMTGLRWAIYETADKKECPHGLNIGNREQFKILFPEDGKKRTLLETQIARENEFWHPTDKPEPFPFYEAGGPTAYGMNLDGRVGLNDFVSPDGEKGIDNQLYRVLGCINSYRGDDGYDIFYDSKHINADKYNRILMEITGVKDLRNSDNVEVGFYRGLDQLITNASGSEFLPGGSVRVDSKWGKKFEVHIRGKIVDGVLITEPVDWTFPWETFGTPTDEIIRAARFSLKLTPDTADGMIGGYVDIASWYYQNMRSESTHHQSYGQISSSSLSRALRRLADAYPDPDTHQNTAISSALRTKFTQVFIIHSPPNKVALDDGQSKTSVVRH